MADQLIGSAQPTLQVLIKLLFPYSEQQNFYSRIRRLPIEFIKLFLSVILQSGRPVFCIGLELKYNLFLINFIVFAIIDSNHCSRQLQVKIVTFEFNLINMFVILCVDFTVKTLMVRDRMVALQLWDTAGQERQYF